MRRAVLLVLAGLVAGCVDQLAAWEAYLSRFVGQPVVRRYSGGADIQAACGTLAGDLAASRSRAMRPPEQLVAQCAQ